MLERSWLEEVTRQVCVIRNALQNSSRKWVMGRKVQKFGLFLPNYFRVPPRSHLLFGV